MKFSEDKKLGKCASLEEESVTLPMPVDFEMLHIKFAGKQKTVYLAHVENKEFGEFWLRMPMAVMKMYFDLLYMYKEDDIISITVQRTGMKLDTIFNLDFELKSGAKPIMTYTEDICPHCGHVMCEGD